MVVKLPRPPSRVSASRTTAAVTRLETQDGQTLSSITLFDHMCSINLFDHICSITTSAHRRKPLLTESGSCPLFACAVIERCCRHPSRHPWNLGAHATAP